MVAQPSLRPPAPVDALHVAKNIGSALAVHLALALNAAIAEGDQAFISDVLNFQHEVVRSAKELAHTRSCESRRWKAVHAMRLLLTGVRLALHHWPRGTERSGTFHAQVTLPPGKPPAQSRSIPPPHAC